MTHLSVLVNLKLYVLRPDAFVRQDDAVAGMPAPRSKDVRPDPFEVDAEHQ